MDNIRKEPIVCWDKKVPDTQLEKFQKIIEEKYRMKFATYWDLHEWTVKNYTKFLEEMWHFFGIISSEPYEEVFRKTGPDFLDNEWFRGAKLNYAENVLRIRDDRLALICLDELGNEEKVTFAEMFEEVKLYASAFRKNGLKIGDTVACYMSNRKEAIFAMLASTAIGAIWGGPAPYYGAQAASKIVSMMDPKFLIAVDSHQDMGKKFPIVDNLPDIVGNAPTLEKVILVVTEDSTRKRDLSNIPNCIFLEDFLVGGYRTDGKVPDIHFEQLPFDHPLCINFTSGTTGVPKAIVHSAGSSLALLRDCAFTFEMESGDVLCANIPVGWSVWDNFIPCLSRGVSLFLYCGSIDYIVNGCNFWDLLSKYKVNYAYVFPSELDEMEKIPIVPSPDSSLKYLKVIETAASPVKKNNFDFLQTKIKKDLLVGIRYGATEVFGCFGGFNMNMPVHIGEIQVPTLGMDLQCFDLSGNSVVGERGEVVFCTPAINFPIGLWKDKDKSVLKETYLSKFPGVWTQHDECWINPITKGFVVIGRSDDILKQNGESIGAADIYAAINSLDELEDYICVSQNKYNGDCRSVLFVKMRQGLKLSSEIRNKIEEKIDDELVIECIPQLILEVPDIPYNLNKKRMESLVRRIIKTNRIPDVKNIRNPESLKHFVNIPEVLNYNI